MRKIFLGLLMLVIVSTGIWAAGGAEKEEAAQGKPSMDKIVYLSVEYHDKPEVHPAWAAEFKRLTGVDIELKTVSSKSARSLMVARFMAGVLPDVMKYGDEKLAVLARQEFIIPLDEFIENSPRMKELKEMYPSVFEAHSVNGVVYGIPAFIGARRALWVRKDILDALGLPVPNSVESFIETMKTIRDKYPKPDGSTMSPLISKTYHHGFISIFGNYFDVSSNPIAKRPYEKKYRDGWDTPNFKEFAEFIKLLWDEKLIAPDHALAQKWSATKTKFVAGEGAFLGGWVDYYPEMISELKKTFPEAELALVPPFKNPKGGVMGLSIVPGYRPFCITTRAKDPQFVWDKVIETLYLTVEGSMLLTRGIPNVSYKIVDNTFVDNFKESGVHMFSLPPLDPDIKFPYDMPALMEKGSEFENQYTEWYSKYRDDVDMLEPSNVTVAYDRIYKDMKQKKNELFWKYVIDEISFDSMRSQFEAYKREIDFQSILDGINEIR